MGTICNYAQNFDEACFYYTKSIEQKLDDYNNLISTSSTTFTNSVIFK